MILENVTQEFHQIVCFITFPPPPWFPFLGSVLFCSCLYLSLSSFQMALWGWVHQVCKLPPASDTSLAESAGSTAGIVRVKLKNNKTCQCRFPSHGAWHQWALKKTAVALMFTFYNWHELGSLPTAHLLSPLLSLSGPEDSWCFPWSQGREGRDRSRTVNSIILFRKN